MFLSIIIGGIIIIMKVKKMLILGLSVLSMFSALNTAYGASIKINDKLVEGEAEPVIVEGRTLVPVRAIFEGLDASVEWDAETKTVTGTNGDTKVVMAVGENVITINGEDVEMDSAAMIIDGRTYAPARYVAEAFGYDVSWDAEAKEVIINDKVESPAATETTTTTEATTETTTATMTNTTAATTVSETTTVTTTEAETESTTKSAADIINGSPVANVSNKVYKLVRDDMKLAFKNYYVGGASSNGRFQRATYSKLFAAWDSAADNDDEKKYVAQSKIAYQNMVTTCTKIDQRKAKYPANTSIEDYCVNRKDKLGELITKYFTSTTVDEATATATEIKNFAAATSNS